LLQDIIKELGSTKKHFMLMGDCNYRFTNWPPYASDSSITREAAEFYECLEDNYFTQHVEEHTRKDVIFDLVITDEQDMVYDLTDLGPLPGCDHNALSWKLEVKSTYETATRQVLDYSKADITAIKSELQGIHWQELLRDLAVDQSWASFESILENVQ